MTEPTWSGLGKLHHGVAHGPGGCLNASDVGSTTGNDVNDAFSLPMSKQEMTCPDTPMEQSHVNEKLRGLYSPGFLGGSCVKWLIHTGAAHSVLSFRVYNSLPTSVKFSLSSGNSAIALADGQQGKSGVVHVVLCLGTVTVSFKCM